MLTIPEASPLTAMRTPKLYDRNWAGQDGWSVYMVQVFEAVIWVDSSGPWTAVVSWDRQTYHGAGGWRAISKPGPR